MNLVISNVGEDKDVTEETTEILAHLCRCHGRNNRNQKNGKSGGTDTMKPTERNLKTNTYTINEQLIKK